MNRELRKQAFTLAETALEKPEGERERWLKAACNDEPDLLREVIAILDADKAGRDFTAAAVGLDERPAEQLIGKTVGHYRIVEVLGQGGMGVVFKGERLGEFQQTVAIKIVRQGLESGSARARFELERDALARIEHPNIARLIDAGVDEQGRPYFVMEYVDGAALDEFLAQNDLDLKARLRLFKRICDAVDAAHRMLIIHRDLKPSNVIITDDLRPKLLDFGISKLVAEDRGPDLTRDGGQLFTPEYASPEQILGGTITTAVDIYGLGALLYFMLSGERPFGERTGALFEYLKATLEDEPLPPSAAIRQRIDPGSSGRPLSRLARAVSGDLDNIVMRALSKRAEQRYASVADFAEDVQRFLDGRAVLAKPPTVAYRVSKFLRRHWLETSLAALFLVSLVAGLAASMWQANVASYERDQANLRFNETRSLVNYLMNDLYVDLDNVPGGAGLRVSISETSQQYLDNLAATRPEDALLIAETAQGYRQLGDMQGSPQEVSLNQPGLAEESYGKALTLLGQAEARLDGADNDIRLRIAEERARTSLKLARLVFMHSYTADWARYSAEAVGQFETLVAQQGDFDAWLGLMDARLLDADVAVYLENWADAASMLEKLVRDLDAEAGERDEEQQRKWDSARMRALATQTDVYFYQDRYEQALDSASAMINAVRILRRDDQDNVALRRAAWVARHKAAQSQATLGRHEDVIETLTEAMAIINPVQEAEPGDAHAKEMIAESHRLIGNAYSNIERHAEAIDHSARVVDYYRQAADEAPDSERSWRLLADARRALAVVLDNAGFVDRACVEWRNAHELVSRLNREFALDSAYEEELVVPVEEGARRCN